MEHTIHIDIHLSEVSLLYSDEARIAAVFKALCDENRIRIIKLLGSGEKCACVLLSDLHITQPTLSHHMIILCDSGLVEGRKAGKWMYYSISESGSSRAMECLGELTRVTPNESDKSCCEE